MFFASSREKAFCPHRNNGDCLCRLGHLCDNRITIFLFNVFDLLCNDYVQYEGANALRFGLARARSVSTISLNYCAYMFSVLHSRYTSLHMPIKKRFLDCLLYFLICAGAVLTLSRVPILLFIALNFVIAIQAGLIRNVERVVIILIVVVAIVLVATYLFPDSLGKMLNSFFSMLMTVFGSSLSSMAALDSNLGDATDRMMLYRMVPS